MTVTQVTPAVFRKAYPIPSVSSNSKLNPLPGPTFGARFVGRTYPEASSPAKPLTLIQLDPHNPADVQWVSRMARLTAHQNADTHLLPTHSRCHTDLGWQHIKASWQMAKTSLTDWILEPPIIIAAANAQKQIVGLCVGHVEQLLPGLKRQYTNFALKAPLALNTPANHTQVEKLYSNAQSPDRCGQSLVDRVCPVCA